VNDVIFSTNCVTLSRSKQPIFESNFKIIDMALLDILIAIIVVGVLLWIINTFIPMDHQIKKIFNLVVVIVLIVWLLKVFGLFSYLMNVHI
jgi:hypothetical protein